MFSILYGWDRFLREIWGVSIQDLQPVSQDDHEVRAGPSCYLEGCSLAVSLLISIPAGIYSAVRQYSKGDYAVVTASFLSSSIPGFFLSLLLVYIFNIKLKLPSVPAG